jgi:hypothetical protein
MLASDSEFCHFAWLENVVRCFKSVASLRIRFEVLKISLGLRMQRATHAKLLKMIAVSKLEKHQKPIHRFTAVPELPPALALLLVEADGLCPTPPRPRALPPVRPDS